MDSNCSLLISLGYFCLMCDSICIATDYEQALKLRDVSATVIGIHDILNIAADLIEREIEELLFALN